MRSVTLYSKGSTTSEHNLFERLTGQLPLQPDGRTRLTVDIMSTAFLLVDSFLVHFTVTWQLPTQGLLLVHAWISSIFRSSDLFFHFVSSRVTNNNLESSLRGATRGHLLSWFLADVMVLVTEWVHLCLTYIAVSNSGKEASLLQMMRFLKVARLLRALSAIQSARFSLLERRHIPIESEHMQPPGQPCKVCARLPSAELQKMHISVQTLTGNTITLGAEASDTIGMSRPRSRTRKASLQTSSDSSSQEGSLRTVALSDYHAQQDLRKDTNFGHVSCGLGDHAKFWFTFKERCTHFPGLWH